jgi:type IV secretory pathway TrbL component
MASKDPSTKTDATGRDANRDPITGTPGSHPVGTGVGAAAGGMAAGVAGAALAGAATGAAATGPAAPLGAAVGAVIGAVAGGLAGKSVAESIDPTAEDAYWRENYKTRQYASTSDASNYDYDRDYAPAYRHGYTAAAQHRGKKFDDVESTLQQKWNETKGDSRLGWEKARHATRDAWHRVERALPGDADGDRR